jgi:hypothetical protein
MNRRTTSSSRGWKSFPRALMRNRATGSLPMRSGNSTDRYIRRQRPKAVKEHPDLSSPQVAMHCLQILQAFYSGILRNYSRPGRLEIFEFSLDEFLTGRLRAGKTFFQQELENLHVDPYFRSLCLLLAALVENDPIQVVHSCIG